MTDQELLAGIYSEAERIREDGTLPVGFEKAITAKFELIAADPQGLEAELVRRAAESGASPDARGGQSESATQLSRRAIAKAARFSRRAVGAARRKVGPTLRVLERRSIEAAGRMADAVAVDTQVASDRARRITAGTIVERGLTRALAGATSGRTWSGGSVPRSLRLSAEGEIGDGKLDRFVVERLKGVSLPVLHTESGDGSLVERLRALGLDASGADPREGGSDGRRGPLEALAAVPRGSLGAVVLSGVTDRLRPSSAHVLVRLISTRLAPEGVVVVLSANPDSAMASDPVGADLAAGRPLHPVTWCHLFARAALEKIAVRESEDSTAYAVAAVRRTASA
ncbi:MAG: class I SAM-dependent methyltransferase [Acidimicrobiales bacterium]